MARRGRRGGDGPDRDGGDPAAAHDGWPRRPAARWSRRIVRLAARAVPRSARRAWRDEWEGELWALDRKGGAGRALLGFAAAGVADAAREGSRERREAGMGPEGMARDLRFALRRLLRAPGFTLVSVAVLALGIGANTALLGALRAALLQPPPYPEPERLVVADLLVGPPGEVPDTLPWSWPKFEAVRESMDVLAAAAGFMPRNVTLSGPDDAVRMDVELVSPAYFGLLGVDARRGRLLAPDEEPPAAARVVVLGHHTWTDRFGGDPDVVGRTLRIDGEGFEVVGVARPGFRGLTGSAGAWLPISAAPVVMDPRRLERSWAHWFRVVGRLAPGVGPEAGNEAAHALGTVLTEAFPSPGGDPAVHGVALTPLPGLRVNPTTRAAVAVVSAGAALLLLIALANVAGLFLARTAARRDDLAVCAALGAGRARLARDVLAESLLLAAGGGAAGILLALAAQRGVTWAAAYALETSGSRGLQFLDPAALGFDPPTLLAGLLLTLLCGVLLGLAPARAASRSASAGELRANRQAGRRRTGVSGELARDVAVAFQLGLTLVLLAGSGLMLASFGNLASVRLGFRAEGVLTARYELGPQAGADEIRAFDAALLERLQRRPGVEAAAVGVCAPLVGPCDLLGVRSVDGEPTGEGTDAWMHTLSVSPSFFDALGIRLLRGRTLPAGLDPSDPPLAVISEAAAQTYFPGVDPLGRRLALTHSATAERSAEIVGVVEDVAYSDLEDDAMPTLYFSAEQVPAGWGFILLRGSGDPAERAGDLRRAVLALTPDRPPREVTPLATLAAAATARTRVILGLLALFGLTALFLSAVGLWGLVSQSVSRRTREMGLRRALGARAGSVLRSVIARPVLLSLGGLALGLAAARLLTPRLEGLLFQVDAADPGVLAAAALLLLAVAVTAALVPARRATRVDPAEALRTE